MGLRQQQPSEYQVAQNYQDQQAEAKRKQAELEALAQKQQQVLFSSGNLFDDKIGSYFKGLESKRQAESERQRAEAAQKEGEYEKNLRQATGLQRSQYEDTARSDLAANIAGVKRDASARGLLFSGIKQGGIAQATNQAAAQTAQGAAQAAQSYRDKLAGYRGEQVNRGLDEYQLAQEKAAADYNTALKKRNAALANQSGLGKALGSIGSAGGAIAGAALPI